ncbi:MAG: S-ribosylhomocysteine lyase [Clostridiales bacterium]|jgi:S-ribosylhomocysteine lyase|nr:S-ribosylhomocysteine lyase [Clostridiales bacterium]
MEKISSFKIDHTVHEKGFYLGSVANGIFTYDLRFKKPNGGDYIPNAAIHTIEHLFATVVRNGEIKDQVVYFGPMGCRTGFYLLLNGIDKERALIRSVDALKKCLELTEIPGASEKECGNYKEHDLNEAKKEISDYLKILEKSSTI